MQVAPPGSGRRTPARVGVAGAARFLLAFTLAWIGVVGAWRLDAFARSASDSGLVPDGAARSAALVWCVVALLAAVALVNTRTVRAGAVLALVVAGTAGAVSVAAWVHATPVVCACVRGTVRRTTRDHVEAVVGDAILLGLALVTLLGTRGRRPAG